MGIKFSSQLTLQERINLCNLGLLLLDPNTFTEQHVFTMAVYASLGEPSEEMLKLLRVDDQEVEQIDEDEPKLREKLGQSLTDLSCRGFTEALKHPCRTAACALGHAALLPEARSADYWNLCQQLFGFFPPDDVGTWLFSGRWSEIDDTPEGAAWRILYFLDRGVPGAPDRCWKEVNSLVTDASKYYSMPEWHELGPRPEQVRAKLSAIRDRLNKELQQ